MLTRCAVPESDGASSILSRQEEDVQRWLRKFEQGDKWTFCLTTAQDAETRREYEQTIAPEL